MSVEELMKPRYKVIADYPDSPFSVGTIYNYNVVDEELRNIEAQPTFHTIHDIERYPHLFKKLEWWEERDGFADFPKYVKLFLNDRIQFIHKVQEWKGYNSHGQPLYYFVNKANYLSPFCVSGLTPANEQQYTDYINSLTKQKER